MEINIGSGPSGKALYFLLLHQCFTFTGPLQSNQLKWGRAGAFAPSGIFMTVQAASLALPTSQRQMWQSMFSLKPILLSVSPHRNHINLPSRSPVWSQHWISVVLHPETWYKGNFMNQNTHYGTNTTIETEIVKCLPAYTEFTIAVVHTQVSGALTVANPIAKLS